MAFAKQHLLTKEENDTTCWYLFTGCFAKSEHEGVRAATVVALRGKKLGTTRTTRTTLSTASIHTSSLRSSTELAEKLKTQSALARCEHLLAILTQEGASASRGSHEYVKTVFDDLAPVFESRLVDTLGYRVPWILHELVLEHFKTNDLMLMPEYVNKTMSILDLGCGTGLVGKCFSDFVREKSTERRCDEERSDDGDEDANVCIVFCILYSNTTRFARRFARRFAHHFSLAAS